MILGKSQLTCNYSTRKNFKSRYFEKTLGEIFYKTVQDKANFAGMLSCYNKSAQCTVLVQGF